MLKVHSDCIRMTSTPTKELVELIEKLVVRQQLNLWECSISDNDICQHIVDLKSQMCISVNEIRIKNQLTEIEDENEISIMDKKCSHILNLIETSFIVHNLKLFELIESKSDLKHQIDELREYHRLLVAEIKSESDDRNVDEANVHLIGKYAQQKPAKCRLKGKKTIFPQLQRQTDSRGTHRTAIEPQVEITSNADDQLFICDICGTAELSMTNLKKHKLLHSTKPKTEFKCIECNKMLYSKTGYESHLLIHNGTKSFECIECKQLFYTMARLKKHTRHVHLKLDKKSKYECKLCDETFASRYFLRAHSFEHSPINQTYECSACKKVYATPVLLRKHVRHMHTHDNDSNVTCEICNKTMPARRYKPHKYYVHTHITLFKCDLCERSFTKRWNLTKHQYTHTDKRPLVCEFCGKGFISQNVLIAHQRIHTGEKPYNCEHCDRTFSHTVYLKSHVKNLHPNEN